MHPIHDYFGIDRVTVWKTAIQDAPKLKTLIARLKHELKKDA
ncbi:hypothetical protein GMMP15_1590001 [Candidatus Magnetomoraceae bacterium gMMP-15]